MWRLGGNTLSLLQPPWPNLGGHQKGPHPVQVSVSSNRHTWNHYPHFTFAAASAHYFCTLRSRDAHKLHKQYSPAR